MTVTILLCLAGAFAPWVVYVAGDKRAKDTFRLNGETVDLPALVTVAAWMCAAIWLAAVFVGLVVLAKDPSVAPVGDETVKVSVTTASVACLAACGCMALMYAMPSLVQLGREFRSGDRQGDPDRDASSAWGVVVGAGTLAGIATGIWSTGVILKIVLAMAAAISAGLFASVSLRRQR